MVIRVIGSPDGGDIPAWRAPRVSRTSDWWGSTTTVGLLVIVWPSVDEGTPVDAQSTTTTAPPRRRVGALDGLRGFALLGMLAWHAEVDAVRGGFARMTIFFVLSGYLATRSWNRRSAEGFPAFWTRRTLRLLPMTLVGVATAVVVTLVAGTEATKASLTADTLSVLTYTSNFHFLGSGQGYGELFERQSAFQHYWSLSIEEQLFLLLPVLLALSAGLGRLLRRPAWVPLLVAAAGVTAASVALGPSADALYFGTHTRLIEFLVGAALADRLCADRPLTPGSIRVVKGFGLVGAGAIVATLVLVDRDAGWLYSGGIHAFALPVIAVIAAIEVGQPTLHRVLDIAPLVWLGRAALSIYVLHWPLFVLIEAHAGEASFAAVTAAKIALALAVGGLAYAHIERPLLDDTRRWLRRSRAIAIRKRLAPMVTAGVAMAVVVAVLPSVERTYDFEEAATELARQQSESVSSAAALPGAPRVAVFGGSTALMNGLGLMSWGNKVPEVEFVPGDARLGCGLLDSGERPEGHDDREGLRWAPVDSDCLGWIDAWKLQAARESVDIALVFFGVWEVADWRLEGASEAMSILDPELRALLRDRLEHSIDALQLGGAEHVVLMATPVVGAGRDDDAATARGLPTDHARRTAAYNDMVGEVAASRSGKVSVFRYDQVIHGLGSDVSRMLPDGVHPTWDTALELWSGPPGEALLAALRAVD